MNDIAKILKEQADIARLRYKRNEITREEAKELVEPYISFYNRKSEVIAKKYKVRPKFINFSSYIR